ncbi:MAG: CotH kinase family protein [Phycisphaerae bacterium]|nr:CotH kinase family protein [Saprospiraceae bacterium]
MQKLLFNFRLPGITFSNIPVFSRTIVLAVVWVTAGLFPSASFAQLSVNSPVARPLFDKKTVGEVRLTLPTSDWVSVLDSLRIYGTEAMPAAVVVDGVRYDGAAVRFRGDKSYAKGLKRNPFSIKLNSTIPTQNHQGYTSIKLSAAVRDPSMAREMLFHEIASKYMPASQAAYTKLYVNEEYIGVFVNVESIDKQFFETNYGDARGAAFKAGVDNKPENLPATCKQNIFGSLEYEDNLDCYKGNFELDSRGGWTELQELTRKLAQEPANVGQVLDVDRALWLLALNNVMVNLSSYSGNYSVNYYLYRDGNNRFQPIHWDLNLSFGSYKNTGSGSDLDLRDLQNLDPLLHADNLYKPLVSQLLKEPLNRKIYLAHIRQINEENFLNGAYLKRAQELRGMIVVPFNDDKNKTYSYDDFQRSLNETVGKRSKIPGLTELMGKRSKFLKVHPELTKLPPMVSEMTVKGRAKFENQKLNAFVVSARADKYPLRMYLYYRFADHDAYTMVVMSEENNTAGLAGGAKSFVAQVEAKSQDAVLDYYILAENVGAVGFLPSNYPKQPFKVKLSDLNK